VTIPDWLSPADPRGKFIWGMVGAVAPEVMRLHRIVTGAARGSLPTFNRAYFIISFANAVIGGFAAVALGGDTWANCFIVGAFWPLVVTAFARHIRR
jgi:hypothetical protein